ncbi:MAG: MotA/TolQ/ExbB proton channel family protein [Deltaproteobacteria bacterium]|nr:MotA/TolQ/ExbB proton channel family protein [Deltaproteobacteria bacterium]
MLEFMEKGGMFMWPILACSVFALAIMAERAFALWLRFRLNAEQFLNQIIGYLEEKKFSRAIEVCNVEGKHPLAEVLKSGLMKANESDREIQRAMETTTLKVSGKVTARISYLSMLANASTLLGLIGTIQGLIQSFAGIASADAAAKQDILSKGIAVAMYTTFFGLLVAIPNVIAYSILTNRQNSLLTQIEVTATDLFNYLSARNQRLAQKKRA